MLYKDKIEQTTFNLPQSLTTDFLIRSLTQKLLFQKPNLATNG